MNEIIFVQLLKDIENNVLLKLDLTAKNITHLNRPDNLPTHEKPSNLIVAESSSGKNNKSAEKIENKFHLNPESAARFKEASDKSKQKHLKEQQYLDSLVWPEYPRSQLDRLLEALAKNSSIIYLNLQMPNITLEDKHISQLQDFFTNRKEVKFTYLGFNNILGTNYSNRVLDILAKSKHEIVSLELANNDLNEAGIRKLAFCLNNNKIRELNIAHNNLLAINFKYFEGSIYLKKVILQNNNLAGPDFNYVIAWLKELVNLNTLNIIWTKLTNQNAISLAFCVQKLFKLRIINMQYNNIEQTGLHALATVYFHHPSLEQLNIDNNGLSKKELNLLNQRVSNEYDLAKNNNNLKQFEEELDILFEYLLNKSPVEDLGYNSKELLKPIKSLLFQLKHYVDNHKKILEENNLKITELENRTIKSEQLPWYNLMSRSRYL